MNVLRWLEHLTRGFLGYSVEGTSPDRYLILRRNIIILMLVVTLVPLSFMAAVNFHQYQSRLKNEIITPLRDLTNKTRHSIEVFLEERLSTARFIASAYSFEELSDEKTLNRIFRILKTEIGGFVDLGLIDRQGTQVSYVGPYSLFVGKNYSKQRWFQEVAIRGTYISDVFMGYREFPHIAIAVQHMTQEETAWILRATIDTLRLENIITAIGLDAESDAFLVNREGIFQTQSKFYGKVLDKCPFDIPRGSSDDNVLEAVDDRGREVILVYSPFVKPDYTLVVIRPQSVAFKSWFSLKSEILFVFLFSSGAIFLVVFTLTNLLVKNIRDADEKRESAFRELEHSQKLSSIGRLAAGVAHEINNPLAIINEKAGLMKDLLEHSADCTPAREKFMGLSDSILQTVNRCRTITHRLLGFARRLEVAFEMLDLNDVVRDVLGFLEKEALYRKIEIQLNLAEDLPRISSDRGQLQQVFLNILTNAVAAVKDGGHVAITTWEENPETIGASIQDNGCGMSEETLRHIFEPFFTTKKGYGTGLGLPITYGIVKKLGGSFKVESKEGQGTTLTVFIPKLPKSAQED